MPPWPLRYEGREAVARFFAAILAATLHPLHPEPTRANRQPALAAYRFDSTSATRRAWGVLVLTFDGDDIAEITGFNDPDLLPWLRLEVEPASRSRPHLTPPPPAP